MACNESLGKNVVASPVRRAGLAVFKGLTVCIRIVAELDAGDHRLAKPRIPTDCKEGEVPGI